MNEGVVALFIPIVSILMVFGIVVAGVWGQAQARRIKAEQRMAMLARGLPVDQIERLLGGSNEIEPALRDPLRSLSKTRRAATVLISSGLGFVAFGLVLVAVTDREKLIVAALGLIPLAIGLGFLVDYGMQYRELARQGLLPETPLR